MNTLKHTFFKNPLYLYIALAFALIIIAAMWHERRNKKLAWAMLIPPALAGIVFAVSALVVTDREQIMRATEEIMRDVQQGSVAAADKYLDDNFGGHWANKPAALIAGRAILSQYKISDVKIQKMSVEVAGREAQMHTVTWFDFSGPEATGRTSLIWDVYWVKRPAGWRIVRIEQPKEGIEL